MEEWKKAALGEGVSPIEPTTEAQPQKDISFSEENKQNLDDLNSSLTNLRSKNTDLQAQNTACKKRIDELNQMIYNLADDEKAHESLKKIVD